MVAQTRLHSRLVTQWIVARWPAIGRDVCPSETGPLGPHTYVQRSAYPSVPEFSVWFRNMILNRSSLGRGKMGEFSIMHWSLALDNIRPLGQESSVFCYVRLWGGGGLRPCWSAYRSNHRGLPDERWVVAEQTTLTCDILGKWKTRTDLGQLELSLGCLPGHCSWRYS